MFRRRPPFEFTKKGYRCNLDADERYLVRRLAGEVRALLTTTPVEDPKMQRLFPPAYDRIEDAEAAADYARLMREELVASRLESLAVLDELFDDTPSSDVDSDFRAHDAKQVDGSPIAMTEDQLHALSKSLNSIRLILGTLLGISDEDGDEDPPVVDESSMALYHYLSWLLEGAVSALMQAHDR